METGESVRFMLLTAVSMPVSLTGFAATAVSATFSNLQWPFSILQFLVSIFQFPVSIFQFPLSSPYFPFSGFFRASVERR
jgi:hypothetical protein